MTNCSIVSNPEKQKNAELQLLQAQINPHFVYNSLGTISCQALLNGQDVIARQLNMLVQIMRYSTKNPNSLVPLETEITIIQQYAEIHRISCDDKVEFSFSIAPECLSVRIPKLMIQPLVENSIIHGIDFTKGNGCIAISAEVTEGGKIIIKVTDNGRGSDMEAINQYIHGKRKLDNDHDSLGVRNVYERIRWVYGSNGDLEYRTNEKGETEAVIIIWLQSTKG